MLWKVFYLSYMKIFIQNLQKSRILMEENKWLNVQNAVTMFQVRENHGKWREDPTNQVKECNLKLGYLTVQNATNHSEKY